MGSPHATTAIRSLKRALACSFLLPWGSLSAQDGSIDLSFDPEAGANHEVFVIALAANGQACIGGWFDGFNGTSQNYFVRLGPDGSLDPGFDMGTGPNNFVSACAIQPDGKLIIGGDFSTINGENHSHIARLNADGSTDQGFIGSVSSVVESCLLQPDGKIFLAGWFNGPAFNYLARLNADGSIDPTFDPGTGPDDAVLDAVLQPDGKIIIGGLFSSFNGTPVDRIARLNPDGSLDNGFNTLDGADANVRAITLQPDGRILIAGGFANYSGVLVNGFARLNADGTLDSGFNTGVESGAVNCSVVQPDGKIIIGGTLTTYDGAPIARIARLNVDGSLDGSFDPGDGANALINTMVMQGDGRILIGGGFTSYDGVDRNRIARIWNEVTMSTPGTEAPRPHVQADPSGSVFTVRWDVVGPVELIVVDVAGELVLHRMMPSSNNLVLDLNGVSPGAYLMKLRSAGAAAAVKLVRP